MNTPKCMCGRSDGWVSVETVDLSEGKAKRTGIFSYICYCGTRVPYAIWHRAADTVEGANLQQATGQVSPLCDHPEWLINGDGTGTCRECSTVFKL